MTISRQLVVRRDGRRVLSYTLKEGACSIGRSPENDLVLPDAAVSPRHAEMRVEATAAVSLEHPALQVETSAAILIDLDSEAGTFVAGERLLSQQPHTMEHGDTIVIGPYELLFRAVAQERAEVSPSQAVAPVASSDGLAPCPGDEAVFDPALPPETYEQPGGGPRPVSRYMRYLPVIFHDDDFLTRFLQLFESVWEPLEQRQNHIEIYFDAATCPADWLPWLASWFGVELEEHWPEARKRALLVRVIDVYRWRGTAYGLERVIEACVGARPRIEITPDSPFVFRVAVRPPRGATPHFEHDLNTIIAAHKPAHAGYTLEILP
jgi:phage tail-like protein